MDSIIDPHYPIINTDNIKYCRTYMLYLINISIRTLNYKIFSSKLIKVMESFRSIFFSCLFLLRDLFIIYTFPRLKVNKDDLSCEVE